MDDPGSCSDNICLIGFMGSGKSTIAKALSERLGCFLIDTDEEISEFEGMSIGEIFEKFGEDAFRKMEREMLVHLQEETILGEGQSVISCGGGITISIENRKLLKEIGKVVYLRATEQTILERLNDGRQTIAETDSDDSIQYISDANRPLIGTHVTGERLRELSAERVEGYEKTADLVIDVDGKSVSQIIEEILNG